jgi:DNA polymerase I-like protein with 3'-5' exonuclease and polymerase domains
MDPISKLCQRELGEYPLDEWTIPTELPSLQNAKAIALDLETSDPDLKKFGPGWATFNGQILGISIATLNKKNEIDFKEYFPINHAEGNLDEKTVLTWLKSELETDIPKVFANNYYDCGWLAAYNIHPKGPWYDIQIAAPLLDEHKLSYSLDNLGAEYCNEHKDETKLEQAATILGIDPRKIKENLHMLNSVTVAPYAIQDAALTLKVWQVLEPMLHEEGLWPIFELEAKLSPVLIAMRMKGVRLDLEKRDKLIEELKSREEDEKRQVNELAGFEVDIWSNKNLAKAYDKLGIDYCYTKASIKKALTLSLGVEEYSLPDGTKWLKTMFDSPVPLHDLAKKSFLETLVLDLEQMPQAYYMENYAQKENPMETIQATFLKYLNPSLTAKFLEHSPDNISMHVRRARKWNKAVSAFLGNSFTDLVSNGRLHCCYHQLKKDEGGTITGRFSCSNPNLQQVPIRDPEIGTLLRSLFIPEEGKIWGSFDYSAQEPRILLHYCYKAEKANAIGTSSAQELVAKYLDDPLTDSHQAIADMITNLKGNILGETPKARRTAAKTINLGKAYVMGKKKLAMNLGISEEEATPIIAAYDEGAAHIKAFQKYTDKLAANRGFIVTLLGRKLHFTSWEPKLPFGDSRLVKPETLSVAQALQQDKNNEIWGGRPIKRAKTYKAINSLIQGSAADMTKKAMVDLYEAGYVPALQVHDELNFTDLESLDQVAEIKKIMEDAIPLEVPVVCEAGTGIDWGAAH